MIIGKYIRQLLNDSKQVVFPGFGNLEVKEVKGTVSQTGAKINPPGLTVKFDSGFSKDDGLLAATMVYGEGMKSDALARARLGICGVNLCPFSEKYFVYRKSGS